jgi:hypothetical protein
VLASRVVQMCHRASAEPDVRCDAMQYDATPCFVLRHGRAGDACRMCVCVCETGKDRLEGQYVQPSKDLAMDEEEEAKERQYSKVSWAGEHVHE